MALLHSFYSTFENSNIRFPILENPLVTSSTDNRFLRRITLHKTRHTNQVFLVLFSACYSPRVSWTVVLTRKISGCPCGSHRCVRASRIITLLSVTICTTWRWMATLTPLPLSAAEEITIPCDEEAGWSRSPPGPMAEGQASCSSGNGTRIPRSV